ncbi:NADH-quinone oxidoreductase subunit K [Gimesia aquarii]|uniref:NADH:ubiquinone oxidoreductase subunit K n=1 Tax=Gimesia aquarii TaxID=2527964 RepID=A0A517W2U5_9PLAN|nr:NADH-quinone oxidoreductase subunit K [Gimesia aquarii]QDT99582.1 NADH:ubiquinone oxidoreductase subunit K [Gimesia aquarii]
MVLLHALPMLHNHLFIAITLIVLGFLGMLLQRNALATVFSLLIWLQGAGLIFTSYSQYQNSREGNLYFLIILFLVLTLLSTLAALIFRLRESEEQDNLVRGTDEPQSVSQSQEGTRDRG